MPTFFRGETKNNGFEGLGGGRGGFGGIGQAQIGTFSKDHDLKQNIYIGVEVIFFIFP